MIKNKRKSMASFHLLEAATSKEMALVVNGSGKLFIYILFLYKFLIYGKDHSF